MPQEPARPASTNPELQVAARRIAQLEADLNNVRRGMVQQLTSSSRLLKAVFHLDEDYFGGRFQAQETPDNKSSQRDFSIATGVVEAVTEELSGAGAFADSPLLRDGVATLVAAIESLRTQARELDRATAEAIGIPVKDDALPARTFPDNNPLACLTETAGCIRDLEGVAGRVRDRINALHLMLHEAEGAVGQVDPETLSATIADELKARDGELASLRAQALAQQEAHAAELRHWEAELANAQEVGERESDLRHGDWAEVRSLTSEIERLAAADPELTSGDDNEITLSVLRDQLREGGGLEAMAAAAEQVLLAWARLISQRADTAAVELAALNAQLDNATSVLQRKDAELANVREQHAQQLRAKEHERATLAAKVQSTEAGARTSANAQTHTLQAQLDDAQARLTAAQTQLQSSQSELKKRSEHTSELEARLKAADALANEAARLRQALASAQAQLATKVDGSLTPEKNGSEALQARLAQAEVAAADAAILRGKLHDAVTARDAALAEVKRLHEQTAQLGETNTTLTRDLQQARDAAAVATKRAEESARQGEDAGKRVTDQAAKVAAALAEADRLKASEARLNAEVARANEERARLERDRDQGRKSTNAELDQSRTDLTQTRQQLTAARSGETQMRADLAKLAAESATASNRVTALERELSTVKAERSQLDGKLATTVSEAERLRTAQADAAKRDATLAAELGELRGQLASALAGREQAAAQKAAWQEMELALIAQRNAAASERDAFKREAANAVQELSRQSATAERLTRERAELAQRLEERESQLTARVAETSRQLGELKVVSTRQNAELDRLERDLAAKAAAADDGRRRTETDLNRRLAEEATKAGEATKRAESAAKDLAERERKLAELERALAQRQEAERSQAKRITDMERLASDLRGELSTARAGDAERKVLTTRLKTLDESLAQERKRSTDAERSWQSQKLEMKALLGESRQAVLKAKTEMERLITKQERQLAELNEQIRRLTSKE